MHAIAPLVLLLCLQDPPAAPPSEIPEYSTNEAQAALRAFRQVKDSAPLAERSAALEALLRGSHTRLVPVLRKVVATEESMLLRKTALAGIGLQPAKAAVPVLVSMLSDQAVTDVPALAEALVKALACTGYPAQAWDAIEGLFGNSYDAERVPVQQAVIQLAREHREQRALNLLLDNLDEPVPKDPHAPDNPPATYWEARWKAWRIWREDVVETLLAITGQRFGTAAEARQWLDLNARKAKIRWK